jgi:serine protease inhibitor
MKTYKSRRMARVICGLTAAVVLAVGLGPIDSAWSQENPPVKPATDLETLVQGNNQFAFDLYARLDQKEGNIVFSPYSISTALAMAYGGARGDTAAEMAKTLHFDLGQERLHPVFRELASSLQKDEKGRPYDLYVANSLWGQMGFPLLSRPKRR